MITVVIPLYNGKQYIARSLQSVFEQDFPPAEIIVVDDGSTDGGGEWVMQTYPGVRVVCQTNQGVSVARNRGAAEAQTPYIAFLDADDLWMPHHLTDVARLIDLYPSCGVFGTSYRYGVAGESLYSPMFYAPPCFEGERGILANYYEVASGAHYPIAMSSLCVKKEALQAIGGFPVGIPSGEDIYTLARLFAVVDFAYTLHPSTVYYHTPGDTKNARPVHLSNPLDKRFDALLHEAAHRKGVRRYVSSWYKQRMAKALLARQYGAAARAFGKAFVTYPFQRKLYTSLLVCLYALASGRSLHSINRQLHKQAATDLSVYESKPHSNR